MLLHPVQGFNHDNVKISENFNPISQFLTPHLNIKKILLYKK